MFFRRYLLLLRIQFENNRYTNEYTSIRHIINKSPWENILKYGGHIQILLVCIHYADTCQRGLPSYGVSPITSVKRWMWYFSMWVKRLKSGIIPMDLTLASTFARLPDKASSTATCTLSPDTKVMCQIRKVGWGELFRVNRSIDIKNYKYISSILLVSQIIIIFADEYQKVLS